MLSFLEEVCFGVALLVSYSYVLGWCALNPVVVHITLGHGEGSNPFIRFPKEEGLMGRVSLFIKCSCEEDPQGNFVSVLIDRTSCALPEYFLFPILWTL